MALLVVQLASRLVGDGRVRAATGSTSSSSQDFSSENSSLKPPAEVRSSLSKRIYNNTPAPPPFVLDKRRRPSTKWTPEIARADLLSRRIAKHLQERSSSSVAEAMADWNESISSRAMVAVINTFGKNWKRALEFFSWAKTREDVCEITIFVYNVMLKVFRSVDQWEESVKVLEELLSRNLKPDSYTFTTFINCAKSTDHVEEAIGWFHKLSDAGVEFDDVTLSSVIDLFGRAGRTAEAIELYQTMRSRNWAPDVITFGVMANVYSKAADYLAVKKLFKEMDDLGMKPNAVLYNILLGALNRANKVSLAITEFDDMERRGVAPTVVTLRVMLDLLTKVGAADIVIEFYERIKAKKWPCDTGVYNTLLSALVDSGNFQTAEEVMAEMTSSGCTPDHQTYFTLMNIYATTGLVQQARDVYEKAIEQRITPRTWYYTVLIRACKQAKAFDKVPTIFEEFKSSKCTPDLKLGSMLVSCITNTQVSDKDRDAIMECIKSACPRLHGLLSRLTDSDTGQLDAVCVETCDFIREEVPMNAQKLVANSFVDFCWASGHKEAAYKVLEAATEASFYKGLHMKLPSIWQIDLRTLSFLTAECALEAWLKRVQEDVENGEELPLELMVETGTGKAKETISSTSLADVVHGVLRARNSPFRVALMENQRPFGYMIASGDAVRSWIQALRPQNQESGGSEDHELRQLEEPQESGDLQESQEQDPSSPLVDSGLQTQAL